jgi:hypothetical protein
VQELLPDVERLVAQVVELEDDRIRLPAVNAGMRREYSSRNVVRSSLSLRLTSAA